VMPRPWRCRGAEAEVPNGAEKEEDARKRRIGGKAASLPLVDACCPLFALDNKSMPGCIVAISVAPINGSDDALLNLALPRTTLTLRWLSCLDLNIRNSVHLYMITRC